MSRQYLQYMEEKGPENQESEDRGVDQEAEVVAQELNVNLPKVNLPLPIKLIAVFTLIGGLSILGGAFADIFNSNRVNISLYLLRLLGGVSFVGISYGIIKKRRSAVWLYGFLVIIGLFINPLFSFLPAAIVVYLYIKRKHFAPSVFDNLINWLLEKIGSNFKDKEKPNVSQN
jgi:hypothetical protein